MILFKGVLINEVNIMKKIKGYYKINYILSKKRGFPIMRHPLSSRIPVLFGFDKFQGLKIMIPQHSDKVNSLRQVADIQSGLLNS